MWHYHDGMGWWMVFGGIWMIIFWGLVVALVVWGIRRLTERKNSGSDNTKKSDALDIARERYAGGEITREEFEQIKKDLS